MERTLFGGRQHTPPSRFLIDVDAQAGGPSSEQLFSPTGFDGEPRFVPELMEGAGVRHQVFGLGTVVELEGETATIYFKGKGTKRLNIAFAPLEKL